MIQQLSKILKSILDDNSLLENSYTYEVQSPDSTPYATLTLSANENDYDTTTENVRVYAFMLRLYQERNVQVDQDSAENAMRGLVDSVLDDLDKNHRLDGLEGKAGYTFLFMEAAPSTWGYVDEPAQYRVAEIVVRCHVSIDTTVIT